MYPVGSSGTVPVESVAAILAESVTWLNNQTTEVEDNALVTWFVTEGVEITV